MIPYSHYQLRVNNYVFFLDIDRMIKKRDTKVNHSLILNFCHINSNTIHYCTDSSQSNDDYRLHKNSDVHMIWISVNTLMFFSTIYLYNLEIWLWLAAIKGNEKAT